MAGFKLLTFCAAILFGVSDALRCASCTNVTDVKSCQNYVNCRNGERCYSTSFGIGSETLFDLGCKSEADCFSLPGVSIIGRSTSSIHVQCSQCCAVDDCNANLCSAGTHITNGVGQCADDPTFDCKHVSTLFNICGDVAHAKTACRKWCGLCDLVDGAWSTWTSWSNCDVTCGLGHVSRSRSCTDPLPAHGGLTCPGNSTEGSTCTLDACPIHGGWSSWKSWSSCSHTCSIGTQSRHRACDNPVPAIAGNHCFGESAEFQACFDRSCADGGWSTWSQWTSCTDDMKSRNRSCDSPSPSQFGRYCVGSDTDTEKCVTNGGWSTWSDWTSCTDGMKSRNRSCDSPSPSKFGRYCVGSDTDTEKCGHIAFTVNSPNGTYINNTLIFTHVVTNLGNGFNPKTGRFTCTIPGLYLFMLSLDVISNDNFHDYTYCYIYRNSNSITYARSHGSISYTTVSTSTYLTLTKGDEVYVGSCGGIPRIAHSISSSFSGALV